MVYSLLYRRPSYRDSRPSSTSGKAESKKWSLSSDSSNAPFGIPESLSFDHVVAGDTTSPCTIRDFMNYLLYVGFAAENLQFYLWFRDYVKRFNDLPESEKALSKPRGLKKHEVLTGPTRPGKTRLDSEATLFAKNMDFGAQTPNETQPVNPFEDDSSSVAKASTVRQADHNELAVDAFESADVMLQPFTVQPFRADITKVIAIYISKDSPRQLNLSARERGDLLQALAVTTHPSAFEDVYHTVEFTLRHQAHPNFIRWAIDGANNPRVVFTQYLGTGWIISGFIALILLTISSAPRAWRALAAFPFFAGMGALFFASNGLCILMYPFSRRHLHPWELFRNAEETYSLDNEAFNSFGGRNRYEDEPWVANYKQRKFLRKVFDREIWIQEPALRQIHDTIFLQTMLVAVLTTGAVIAIFIALPSGNKF